MPDTTDAGAIHPKALRAARKRAGLSQQQLADTINCTKDTVSRWERGNSRRVRSHLRKPLSEALGVRWEKLTEPPKDAHSPFTASVKMTVGLRVPNALRLVAERYGVRTRDVVELAPLFFFIAAERSLLDRRRRVEKICAVLDDGEEGLKNDAGHLDAVLPMCRWRVDDALLQEEESIAMRDIFGRLVQSEDWYCANEEGPFVTFVRTLAEGLVEDPMEFVKSFSYDIPDRYAFAEDTLRGCTGISGEGEEDERLRHHLRGGRIDLAECLRIKQGGDETAYREWLSDALIQADEEVQKHAISALDL